MENLADISLDLICALKFAPPGGYEMEDIAAMENACWQTLLHGLDPEERAAIVAAAERHIEELCLEPLETLPDYLTHKLNALEELVAQGTDCSTNE